MFFVFHASVFPHYGLLSLYVCISHILPAVTNESFSCGLNASCIEILNAQVCVPPRHGVYPAPQLAESPPRTSSQVCMCTRICIFTRVCVWERQTERSLLWFHAVTEESRLWDMPGCQEHPPPTLYTLTVFPLICMDATAKLRLFCFLLPSGDRAKCFPP